MHWQRSLIDGTWQAVLSTPAGRWICRVDREGSWLAVRSGLDIAGGGGTACRPSWGHREVDYCVAYALDHDGRMPTRARLQSWPRGRAPRHGWGWWMRRIRQAKGTIAR